MAPDRHAALADVYLHVRSLEPPHDLLGLMRVPSEYADRSVISFVVQRPAYEIRIDITAFPTYERLDLRRVWWRLAPRTVAEARVHPPKLVPVLMVDAADVEKLAKVKQFR